MYLIQSVCGMRLDYNQFHLFIFLLVTSRDPRIVPPSFDLSMCAGLLTTVLFSPVKSQFPTMTSQMSAVENTFSIFLVAEINRVNSISKPSIFYLDK